MKAHEILYRFQENQNSNTGTLTFNRVEQEREVIRIPGQPRKYVPSSAQGYGDQKTLKDAMEGSWCLHYYMYN